MPLTPDTLTRHELVGLPVRVADAANPDLVGIAGRVVDETANTLLVRGELGVRQVPKRGATFEFALPVAATQPKDRGGGSPAHTDEAAGDRETAGDASELGTETAGVRPRQSGPSGSPAGRQTSARETGEPASRFFDGECEGAVYVTVDGARLVSRPAERTENAGDSTWR